MVKNPVIITLTQSAMNVAVQLKCVLKNADIHGLDKRVTSADISFSDTGEHLRQLFRAHHPIIGICASAILIRCLAAEITNKNSEPAVIAVAEDGSAVVPLLGGHNGANELARKIADHLNIKPAITTAGDLHFDVALDNPPEGWVLANPENAKDVMAALLSGATASLQGVAPWLSKSSIPFSAEDGDTGVELIATEYQTEGTSNRLVYHPKNLALGVGCERGAEPDELISLADEVIGNSGIAKQSIGVLASIDIKADEPAVLALADYLSVPARFFSAKTLNAEAHRLANPSELVMAEVGCPGVAEGAALAATGPTSTLLVAKTKSRRATAAIARSDNIIQSDNVGCRRGRLVVVGVGPGKRDWRSPEASQCLTSATDWVGYGLYLDLVRDLLTTQKEHRFPLGEEQKRVEHALALANEGREVALVCSGDAGIYAMASLVFEVLEQTPMTTRAEVKIIPGISAFQAAAAKSGAPIGHDFCAISLSDLLTPWDVIEKRIEAAAVGDFVTAFYNPKSERRTMHIVKAMEILSTHRPANTPVIIASSLGRENETIAIHCLKDFSPEKVDMLSLVIVGASTSRIREDANGAKTVYTPRGYEAKRKDIQ